MRRKHERISVTVTFRGDRGTFYARVWRGSRLVRTESLGVSRRRDAERMAAQIEADEIAGLDARELVPWVTFVSRAAEERFAPHSESYRRSWLSAANRFAALVRPEYLQDANQDAISKFSGKLHAVGYSRDTIVSYMKALKIGLQWAGRVFRASYTVPDFDIPERYERKARGRPINNEQWEVYRSKFRQVVEKKHQSSWLFLAWGIWLGGLRISEAARLRWSGGDMYIHNIDGARPMMVIQAEGQKGRRDQAWPLPPDFVKFLRKVSPRHRTGFVFRPMTSRGRAGLDKMKRVLSTVGEKSRVVVGEKTRVSKETGKRESTPKYVSAHDLRRSFLQRWWRRFQKKGYSREDSRERVRLLGRHRSFSTTDFYYLDSSGEAENLASDMWSQFGNQSSNQRQTPNSTGKRKC